MTPDDDDITVIEDVLLIDQGWTRPADEKEEEAA